MRSKVLVTGATGKAGRFVVPALQRLGFDVRGQYRRAPGQAVGVDWRRLDFFESLDFGALVAGCDAVVHLAAELGNASHMDRVNVEATRALLDAARSSGVRYFGHASSIVVYGSPDQRAVDESTPILDPYAPIARQYSAEPYMLEYARTKALGELAIRKFQPSLSIDIYRPTVVVDFEGLLEAGNWSFLRKMGASYRRTQYIYAADAAAAIAHLVVRGVSMERNGQKSEAFNICDDECGTFRDLLAAAYRATRDPRYKARPDIPVVLDRANNLLKYPNNWRRYPLGMLVFSNAKLLATGFNFPTGFKSALNNALRQLLATV
jgi:nucleoside-diphosphate-sugar epimerase